MSKNKTAGISEILKEQAKERLLPANEEPDKKNNISEEKIRKNFYIEKDLVKLLRKMAYEKETDQTKIVNEALETFFKEHGYIR